ncbi:MAG: hypothetical protein AAF679_11780 [Pseudomonadota bacterium]
MPGLPVALIYVAVSLLWIIPFWRLTAKMGLDPRLSIMTFFPILAIAWLWFLAFYRDDGPKGILARVMSKPEEKR